MKTIRLGYKPLCCLSICLGPTLFTLLVCCTLSRSANLEDSARAFPAPGELSREIPVRSSDDLTGSGFMHYILPMGPGAREQAIFEEVAKGNVPAFLRNLVPVELHAKSADGKSLTATIFVTPDYLAIGSDADFLRIPMNLHTAVSIAERFGFVLPTKKMVDAIYQQSSYRLAPQPLPAGPQMRSTAYYATHNQMIESQMRAIGGRLGALISGNKKDVVMSNRLATHVGRIAIYGWHRGPDQPIQPLSTVHGANYADYSHGIRLVSQWAMVNGKLQRIQELLLNPSTATIFSDEGPIRLDWERLEQGQETSTRLAAGK